MNHGVGWSSVFSNFITRSRSCFNIKLPSCLYRIPIIKIRRYYCRLSSWQYSYTWRDGFSLETAPVCLTEKVIWREHQSFHCLLIYIWTRRGRGEKYAIVQTAFLSYFFSEYCCILIQITAIEVTIRQHSPGLWLGVEQATSHYLNQWWTSSLTHVCVTRHRYVKSLYPVIYQ